jgi:hypothetical protein
MYYANLRKHVNFVALVIVKWPNLGPYLYCQHRHAPKPLPTSRIDPGCALYTLYAAI